MTRINLLPWREAARELRRRRFLGALAVTVMLGGGVVLLADAYIARAIERLHLRNQYLEQASTLLDQRIADVEALKLQRQQLLERFRVVEELQRSRASGVRVFEQLARSLPEGAYLTEIDQQGESLGISGVARANDRISELLRNLQASDGFAAPALTEVKNVAQMGRQPSNLFRLNVQQVPVMELGP
ncbi:PilN domain-containing protein [Pseudomonas sp. MPFS]|uniref:PilN domain-containing protein n=1 Tax=Pseudomonas sp. MPFS TaxID=2795724 RepID=UPI001F148E01|nr:PilN domain-containing protein [Pseudomonas sp. MPFS]UMZ12562.1 PilN domain-containing protein [Pseudomonas sp. MPFS]